MALAQLGQFIFHCGNSVTQFNSQDSQNCIGPIQTIKPDDSPSRISLSAFQIYWPPFITWRTSPQLINILDLFLSLFSFTLLKSILIILSSNSELRIHLVQSLLLASYYPGVIPIQHSPPERQTRCKARAQAVLTPTPRPPLDGTPAVPQLRAQLDRGPHMEGAAPSRKEGRGPRRSSSFPGVSRTNLNGPGEDGEEEESDGTEGAPSPVGVSQGTGGPTLAQSEPSLLAIMQKMT
ncbi:hypothetical protein O181_095829 [Austropuccinia psidii MF-1]|uniref:Uncharacterized protein n=1 Tax=Austropuccinia psidii MF-1 TaxID=1389203 RepID=A0A9Q3PC50_9BASI|nr:hypothetical protein [Austropuccinia psidii MF-1]